MEVREEKGFKGLYATRAYKIGELVVEFDGEEVQSPTRTSVQVGEKHYEVGYPVQYINHDCKSNIERKGKSFYAMRDIKPGDEILFNYLDNEWEMANPFDCRKCGQQVKGKKYVEEFPCLLKTC
jgi:SET domain-containing protein